MTRFASLTLLAALLCAAPALAQEVNVRLRDGSEVRGELLGFESATYRVKTADGVREVAASGVASVEFVDNTVPKGGWRASFDLNAQPTLPADVPAGPYGYLDLEGRRFGRLPNFMSWTKSQRKAYTEATGGDVASWADLVVSLEPLELMGVPRKARRDAPEPGRLAREPAAVPDWTGRIEGLAAGQRLRGRSRAGREFALLVRRAEAGKLVLDVTPTKQSLELPPIPAGAWRAVLNAAPALAEPYPLPPRRVACLNLAEQRWGPLPAYEELDAAQRERTSAQLGPEGAPRFDLCVVFDEYVMFVAEPPWLHSRFSALDTPYWVADLKPLKPFTHQTPTRERYRIDVVHADLESVVLDVTPLGKPLFCELKTASGETIPLRFGYAEYEDGLFQLTLHPQAPPGTWFEELACPAPELEGFLQLAHAIQPKGTVQTGDGALQALQTHATQTTQSPLATVWITGDALSQELDGNPVPFSALGAAGKGTVDARRGSGGWSGAALSLADDGQRPFRPWETTRPWALCSEGGATVSQLRSPLEAAPELGPRSATYGKDGLVWVEFDYGFADGSRLRARVPVQYFEREGMTFAVGAWSLRNKPRLSPEQRSGFWPRVPGSQWVFRETSRERGAEPQLAQRTMALGEAGALTLATTRGDALETRLAADEAGKVWLDWGDLRLNLGGLARMPDMPWTFDAGPGWTGKGDFQWLVAIADPQGKVYRGAGRVWLELQGATERAQFELTVLPGIGPLRIHERRESLEGELILERDLWLERSTLEGDPPLTPLPRARREVEGYTVERVQVLPDSEALELPTVHLSTEFDTITNVEVRHPFSDAPLLANVSCREREETTERTTGKTSVTAPKEKAPFSITVKALGYRTQVFELVPKE